MGGEGKHHRPRDTGLAEASKMCQSFFVEHLGHLGLIAKHAVIDRTDYFIVPKAGTLELLWYYEHGFRGNLRAVCELGFNGNSYSRITWTSEEGWSYSLLGGEDESQISDEALNFLNQLNRTYRFTFKPGINITISEQDVPAIVRMHAIVIYAQREGKN